MYLCIYLYTIPLCSPKPWIDRVDDLFSAKSDPDLGVEGTCFFFEPKGEDRLSQFFMGKPTINIYKWYLLVPRNIGKL